MALKFMKKKTPLPLPAGTLCVDEATARALAQSRQALETDPSIRWTESLRSDGQWVASAYRPGSNHETFLGYGFGEVLNPLNWLDPSNWT
jgi:hypothetical protein